MSRLIKQLGYVGFEVSDMARWERFATDVVGLGLSKAPRDGARWLRLDEHRWRIALLDGPADDIAFCGWQVANAADVEAFGKHLDNHGVSWAWASDDDLALRVVERMLHFKDPLGNRHEVFCNPRLAIDQFVSPRIRTGFLTGNEGLGHLVYWSTDPAKSIRFGREVLQLGHSDDIFMPVGPGMRFDVTFMHANPRHHTFAIATQPPVPGPFKRLHHLMIETNSIIDVGFARDRFLGMGLKIPVDIGQHTNDKMLGFYGETPSGFLMEIGFGGSKIENEDTWLVGTYRHVSQWGHRPVGDVALNPPFPPPDEF